MLYAWRRSTAVLRAIGKRLLVAEGDRSKSHEASTGIAHVLDVFFVAPRGTAGAELACGVDQDRYGVVVLE